MTEDNRIPEIRAVLSDPMLDEAMMLDQVNAILDSAPPAPRVFLPGDTVPAGVQVSISFGARLLDPDAEDRVLERTAVEVVHLSPEEWQAAVDRARAAREENPDG